MRAGIIATYLIVPILFAYPLLPGSDNVEYPGYGIVLAGAIVGAVIVSWLPWEQLFRSGAGDWVRSAWSVLDIVLVTVGLHASGGAVSPLFGVYALTTIFFAVSYPLRSQVALLVFTFAAYATTIPGSGVGAGGVVVRLGVLASLAFLGGFLSHELKRVVAAHRDAQDESDHRARLLGVLAGAGGQLNVLDPQRVLAAVVDAAVNLGFDAADLCVLDDHGTEYEVVQARGLPPEYTEQRHPAPTGLVGRVLATRRTVVVSDYAHFDGAPEVVRGVGYVAVVAVPVWVQGRLAAVLEGGRLSAAEVRPDEVEAFELLAYQVGRAIENARRFEEERRMVERLGELDRLKGDFLSNASHELRTPLTVVLGMSRTLADHWFELDEATRHHFVDRLNANADSLDQIVSSLLDFSRLERSPELELVRVDLGALVKAAVERLEPLFREHDVDMIVDDGLVAEGDARMIDRVVENLLGNAAKHTPPGTSVTVRVHADGDDALVSVEDDGPGIASDDLLHLGERFFRGGDANTRATRGLGLGLALAREILDLHGSTLEIESAPGHGARFAFRIGLAGRPASNEGETSAPADRVSDRS